MRSKGTSSGGRPRRYAPAPRSANHQPRLDPDSRVLRHLRPLKRLPVGNRCTIFLPMWGDRRRSRRARANSDRRSVRACLADASAFVAKFTKTAVSSAFFAFRARALGKFSQTRIICAARAPAENGHRPKMTRVTALTHKIKRSPCYFSPAVVIGL